VCLEEASAQAVAATAPDRAEAIARSIEDALARSRALAELCASNLALCRSKATALRGRRNRAETRAS
jgi:hypothetical protein